GYTPVFHERKATPEMAPVASEPAPRRRRTWRWIVAAFAGASLVVIGLWRVARPSEPIPIVLPPLGYVSQDGFHDYFADGLTGEIIRDLSIIEGLAVRSRTSSFAFKGKQQNVHEAARQLAADYILEGTVLRAGQQLRITAQLVRVRDDFPMWSGRY